MASSFWHLFKMNLKLLTRNPTGLFFTIIMPVAIYIALSVLPIGNTLGASSYSNYILPGIIAMVTMQSGIYGLAYWMVDMKSRGVIKRFLVTPIKTRDLILSLLLARAIVILFQAAVLTTIGIIFFHATFAGNIISSIVIVILGAFIFLLVGLIISMVANSYEAAAPITAAVGLPLTFLGNIFFPTDALPKALQAVARLLPITYMADALRKVFLNPFSFASISKDLLILAIWFVVILLFVLWRFRLHED
jgi:ABC-2 type transport system permease protein